MVNEDYEGDYSLLDFGSDPTFCKKCGRALEQGHICGECLEENRLLEDCG